MFIGKEGCCLCILSIILCKIEHANSPDELVHGIVVVEDFIGVNVYEPSSCEWTVTLMVPENFSLKRFLDFCFIGSLSCFIDFLAIESDLKGKRMGEGDD